MNSKNIYSFVDNRTTKQRRLDTKENLIKRSFYGNINYEQVYKNGSQSNTLDCWIYDDKSERKDGELKFIQPHPDQNLVRGDYIHWQDGIWLVRGINPQYKMATIGMMYKCLEPKFRWIDNLGLHEIPFYAQSKVLRDPLLDNSKLYLVDDSMEAYVQENDETITMFENMRFAFGANTIYKIIEIVDFYIEGIIKIILKKDEQVIQDDFVNHIAYNDRLIITESEEETTLGNDVYIISSENDKISFGKTGMFNVAKLTNDIEVALNSNITCSKTGEFIFTVIDDNNFSIKNIRETNLDITITITDLDNNKTVDKILRLRAW